MKAYVLVETGPGKVKDVFDSLRGKEVGGSRISALDAITGPYDIIAVVEGPDLASIGNCVTQGIGVVPGVQRTLTCLAVSIR